MALVLPNTPCVLCERPLGEERDYFATSGVFLPPDDPLRRCCDAPMH